jgi:hypothetical protein
MPQLFYACDTPTGSVAMECCLNSAGERGKCGPCPRCTFTVKNRRCKNTSCADSRLCHVHAAKEHGVRTIDTAFGKGLRATRAFAPGDLICPMGGRRVKGAQWADRVAKDATSPYGYVLSDAFSRYRLYLRDTPTVDGYRARSEAAGGAKPAARWMQLHTPADRAALDRMRRAYRDGTHVYLVDEGDWDAFIADATEALWERYTPAQRRRNFKGKKAKLKAVLRVDAGEAPLAGLMHRDQFAARMEVKLIEGPVLYDAACVREIGSYANDGRDLTNKRASRRNNAAITPVSPHPLRQGAWLVATAAIAPGDEVLVDYTSEYWKGRPVHYGVRTVPKSPGFGGTDAKLSQADKGRQFSPPDKPCPQARRSPRSQRSPRGKSAATQ